MWQQVPTLENWRFPFDRPNLEYELWTSNIDRASLFAPQISFNNICNSGSGRDLEGGTIIIIVAVHVFC